MRGILVHQKLKTEHLCCLVVATTWACTNTKVCGCVSLVMISSHNLTSLISHIPLCEHVEWNRYDFVWHKCINIHWNEFSYTTMTSSY